MIPGRDEHIKGSEQVRESGRKERAKRMRSRKREKQNREHCMRWLLGRLIGCSRVLTSELIWWSSLDCAHQNIFPVYQCLWINFLFRQPSHWRCGHTYRSYHFYDTKYIIVSTGSNHNLTLKPLTYGVSETHAEIRRGTKKKKIKQTVQWKRTTVWTVSFNWPAWEQKIT